MADKMDRILNAAAEQADARVDYAAMHAAVLKKAVARKKTLQKNIIRCASAAAAVVLMLSVGIGLLQRGGYDMMEKASPETADMGAQNLEDNILGGGDRYALAPGGGATPAAPDDSGLACPDVPAEGLPPQCGNTMGYASLYWAEKDFELPVITFSEDIEVLSDASRVLYTIIGGTQEDGAEYVARVLQMYPEGVILKDELGLREGADAHQTVLELLDGAYRVTVSFEQGMLSILAETAQK